MSAFADLGGGDTPAGKLMRGRIVVYALDNLDTWPDNDNALDLSGIRGRDGNMMASLTNKPSRTNVLNFKRTLQTNYREYLDNLFGNFKSDVSLEAIGALAGSNINLQAGTVSGFIAAAGGRVAAAIGGFAQASGEAKKAKMRSLKEMAILNPDQYVKQANDDKKDIEEKAVKAFTESFKLYYEKYEYPEEEAKRLAIEDMKKYKQMLLERHKQLFDVGLYEEASKKIYKTGNIV